MINVIAEIWASLKPDLEHNSIENAAESVINILLDHDYDANEIKRAFRRDKDFLEILEAYQPPSYEEDYDTEIEEEEYEDEYEEDEDDWH